MENYDVIIAGAGPAGSSAAILLAQAGVRALLLEEKRMPRDKVCGEFITPESFPTLERLGLMDSLNRAGACQLKTVTLCAENGRQLSVPIASMSGAGAALGLSRACLDHMMLSHARQSGAVCLESAAVRRCIFDRGWPCGVEVLLLDSGKTAVFRAPLIVDATGRNSRMMVDRQERQGGRKGRRLYAMKAHLEGVQGIQDRVELYFFRRGYGGLSGIEGGLANLCFIISEQTLRSCGGDAGKAAECSVMTNPAARSRLQGSRAAGKWLTVGPLTFGKKRLSRDGVIAIGDAAGMIDPFTGTGIQIALRSGELLAQSVIGNMAERRRATADDCGGASPGINYESVLERYERRYDSEFGERMWVARILRRAAFSVATANFLARVLVTAPSVSRKMMKATRNSGAGA